MNERYLTVVEVAALARCEHKAVRRAIGSGRLEAFRGPGRLLVRETVAREWIEARPVQATAREPRKGPARHRLADNVDRTRVGHAMSDYAEAERIRLMANAAAEISTLRAQRDRLIEAGELVARRLRRDAERDPHDVLAAWDAAVAGVRKDMP